MYGGVNGYERYLETAVETASPARLIVMLYDGAIRFINEALYAMRQRDYETQNARLQRAQKILAELISSLDFDKGGEIAENLFRLYTYMYNQLVEANLQDSPERLEHVVDLLSDLREAWDTIATEAEAQVRMPTAKVSLHG
ncbi:MAG: flagellar export chaperone FliS [Fimbriimonadales bacterium]|nr:flagellar export chaperone FliS [Fimbriimonadales bacterium]